MKMKKMFVCLLLILLVSGTACSQNASLRKGLYINTDNKYIFAAVHPDTSFSPKQLLFPKSGSYVIGVFIGGEITTVNVGHISGNKVIVTAQYDDNSNVIPPSSPSPYDPEFIIINSQSYRVGNSTFGYSTFIWNRELN
jgi:hypothetical protein